MIYTKKFIGFSDYEITTYLHKNKTEKKDFKLPKRWSNSTENIFIKEDIERIQGILAGKKNNLTIIDFDQYASYISFTEKFPYLLNSLRIKSKKGYHIYLHYEPKFKSDTNCFKSYDKIDIINDGCFIVAPQSYYTDLNNKKIIYTVDNNKDILKLNSEQVNELLNEIKEKKYNSEVGQPIVNNIINKDEINEIAHSINNEFLDNYDDWKKIVWSLASIDYYDLSVEISKKNNKFDLNGHDKIYNLNNNRINIGTLFNYSKMSNENTFLEIKNKYKINEYVDETDYILSTIYLQLKGNNILKVDNQIFIYTNPYWKLDNKRLLIMRDARKVLTDYINNIHQQLYTKLNDIVDENERNNIIKEQQRLLKIIKAINSYAKQKSLVDELLTLIDESEIVLDMIKPNYFCFKNIAFDIFKNEEVIVKKEDYISQYADYDYKENTPKELETIKKIISEIMPDKLKLECFLSLLKSMLSGNNEPYLVLFNGSGSNGKGWILEFMEILMGKSYFIRAKKEILTVKSSRGASDDLARLDKKRGVIFSEPEESEKLNTGCLKEYTDTPSTEARGLYQDLKTIYFTGFLCMECNQRPVLKGRADYAILRRIIDLEFSSSFVDDKDDIINEHYFKKDITYKTPEFIKEHRIALFNYILSEGKNKIFIPEIVSKRGESYILDNDELISWFDENYEITGNKEDYIQCKSLYTDFTNSTIYSKLNNEEKRTNWNKKNFIDNIRNNIKLRKLFIEKHQPKINGKQIVLRQCLIRVKEIENNDENNDLDCM